MLRENEIIHLEEFGCFEKLYNNQVIYSHCFVNLFYPLTTLNVVKISQLNFFNNNLTKFKSSWATTDIPTVKIYIGMTKLYQTCWYFGAKYCYTVSYRCW